MMAAEMYNLSVGLKIDFLFTTAGSSLDNFWFIATIVNTTEDSIKIHYDCDGDRTSDDTWIDKISERW